MTYRGKVVNGVVVLNGKVRLAEGSEVMVQPRPAAKKSSSSRKVKRTLAERLASVIGKATGLPADGSVNLDHYLYGLPKRS